MNRETIMKNISIGKYIIPSWILGVVLIGLCIGAFALYMALTFTIPFEVKEPIEVLHYPSYLSLYPGDTVYFNVTVQNNAKQNYTVLLDFSLSNATYENSYVTFSNETYFVGPGVQNLTAWIIVSPEASPINAILTVKLFRTTYQAPGEEIKILSVQFLGSGTIIRVTLRNTGTSSVTLVAVYVNDIERNTTSPFSQTVLPNDWLTLDIESPWVSGSAYQIQLVTSKGNIFTYYATAPSS